MKQAIKYSAGLIGLYLIVAHGTSAGKAMYAGAAGSARIIKAFQGR